MATSPILLLINPWIYDFAAYDFFARPLGLLYLASYLSAQGYEVHLLDCLDTPLTRAGVWGTGRYPKEIIPTPQALRGIPRRYGRYGLREADFKARLAALPRPDAILVTSLMTYWYPGVQAAIRLAREQFPAAPVILGGIYATLCPEHARKHSGADFFLAGPGEEVLVNQLTALGLPTPAPSPPPDLDSRPYPALDLIRHLPYLPILTSRGCPFDCTYCASRLLQPRYQRRQPLTVIEEMRYWQERLHLTDVAFYDDALLLDADNHLLVILEELAKQSLSFRFHTPNGLHTGLITKEVARWLKRSQFATLRLGVETVALGSERLDHKLQAGELEAALRYLQEAGFRREEIGVYLLMGLPHQEEAEITTSIRRVKELGGAPVLAQYSPIPGTELWAQAVATSRYDLARDPLFHNNSLFPCWPQFSWERYSRLKRLVAA
ncbi:MAG: B12-binding domain-containing radical SAM protein [Thermodesulfobacteriota bacterium]